MKIDNKVCLVGMYRAHFHIFFICVGIRLMDWIAQLENKKTSICTETDPTKPTKYDFNRVRVEKNKDTHKNEPYKNDKTNVANSFLWGNVAEPEQPFDYETHLTDAMHSLNRSLMDVSLSERKRSYQLEEQIHEAWGENRQTDFIRLVDEWRRIFK